MRYGYTPDVVDSWPVEWSSGWLLERVIEAESVLRTGADTWDDGAGIGFGFDDPDWDPAFAGVLSVLPMIGGEGDA